MVLRGAAQMTPHNLLPDLADVVSTPSIVS
jgi:hypothetical protein